MATTVPRRRRIKTRRQKLIETAVLVPLDWVDERTAAVRGTKWFLFRHVPRDVNWMQTLWFATLTAFLSQTLTGAILAMYYKPSPNEAYPSIQHITNDHPLGWLDGGWPRRSQPRGRSFVMSW